MLDFLFPKQTSWNVTGFIEPKNIVKKTILLSGHMDCVYEFKWWYRLKQFGAFLTVLGSSSIIFQAIGFLIIFCFFPDNQYSSVGIYIYAFLLLLIPSTIMVIDMRI